MRGRIDIGSLTGLLGSLYGLTGLRFSLYDDRLCPLISPPAEDLLLSVLKCDQRGRELYADFLNENLRRTLQRNQPFLAQGPTKQYHIFIPVRYREIRLAVVAEAFYASVLDFREYCKEYGQTVGFRESGEESWFKELRVIQPDEAEARAGHIRSLVENVVALGCEKDELAQKWRSSKTIVSLMANIDSDMPVRDIYRTLVDAAIFLFNVDTAAVFSRADGHLMPAVSAGRQRSVLESLTLTAENLHLARASAANKPVSVMDGHELRLSGFPDEIISMYLFPIASGLGSFGFLGVFNSLLSREAFGAVNELCLLSAHVCGARSLRDECEKEADSLSRVSAKISQLSAHCRNPHLLHESIVQEASHLVNAEKCSLMMPEYNENALRVFAVKGLNRWLMGGVKVSPGEGIAGKVFEEGVPMLIDGEELIREYVATPKPHYKTASSICLPLRVADETLGVLNLSDKYSGEAFSKKDLSILSEFGRRASVLLKLAESYEMSEQMKELAVTDPLTSLFNRRCLTIRLQEEYQRAKRYDFPISLAMIDVDDFKQFNDAEGHLAGDYMLKEIASVMSSTVRANDIVVRYGGEEFVILMPQTLMPEAFGVVERIRENIGLRIPPTWKKFAKERMTVCAGIAMYPDCGELKDDLIRCADRALYRAKLSGKNCVLAWDSSLDRSGEK
jgi:diguanylate cyclase (GGDEF)-like protein